MITTIGSIVRGDREVFPPYLYEAYRSTLKRAPGLYHHDIILQGAGETAFFNL